MGLSCPGPGQGQAGLLPSPQPWAPDCLSPDLEGGGRKFTVGPGGGELGRPREGKGLARGHQHKQHPLNCISLSKARPLGLSFPSWAAWLSLAALPSCSDPDGIQCGFCRRPRPLTPSQRGRAAAQGPRGPGETRRGPVGLGGRGMR